MGNGPKQNIFKRRQKEGQEEHENMLKVTNYPRHANQNDNAVPSHTCQNGNHQQINKQQVLARMRRKKNPHARALMVGMQTGAATVENSMESPQKTKNGTSI